jgi:hypothetical protein
MHPLPPVPPSPTVQHSQTPEVALVSRLFLKLFYFNIFNDVSFVRIELNSSQQSKKLDCGISNILVTAISISICFGWYSREYNKWTPVVMAQRQTNELRFQNS